LTAGEEGGRAVAHEAVVHVVDVALAVEVGRRDSGACGD
jgi:hypothetical protein